MFNDKVCRVIDRLKIKSNDLVLDIGCGDGDHSKYTRLMSPNLIVALDLDFFTLQNLAHTISPLVSLESTGTISFACADALSLPFASECFDCVICSLVLYFLPFQNAVVELSRVVKPNGKVYLRVPILTANRIIYIVQQLVRNPRKSAYTTLLAVNGLYYLLTGKQFANPLLRHESWACFVPYYRFKKVVTQAGLKIDVLEIDRPKLYATAIDAWLRKA